MKVNGGSEELEGIKLLEADVVAEQNRYRHDPDKLAGTILRLYDGRGTFVTDVPRVAQAPANEKQESLAR